MVVFFILASLLQASEDQQRISPKVCGVEIDGLVSEKKRLTMQALTDWTFFCGSVVQACCKGGQEESVSSDIGGDAHTNEEISPPGSTDGEDGAALAPEVLNLESKTPLLPEAHAASHVPVPAAKTQDADSVVTPLAPDNLFERPLLLPKWYLGQMNEKLVYLHECGLTQEVVRAHFLKNWARVRENLQILDVGCDVGFCHLQAEVNREALISYGGMEPQNIPFHVMAYVSFCVLLSDHSEERYGAGSVGYLYHPGHASKVKSPETFPLSGYVTVGSKKKLMQPSAFFPRLRMVVAMQALLQCSDGFEVPETEAKVLTGIPAPTSSYNETFCLFFSQMRAKRIPFLVNVVHISPSERVDRKYNLSSEHAVGFYPDYPCEGVVKDAPILCVELYTFGLSSQQKAGMLEQLRNFYAIEKVITAIVTHTHEPLGKSLEEKTLRRKEIEKRVASYRSGISVDFDGWLSEFFGEPSSAKAISLFDEKFDLGHIEGLRKNGRCGLSPRHLYCTTMSQFLQDVRSREEKFA